MTESCLLAATGSKTWQFNLMQEGTERSVSRATSQSRLLAAISSKTWQFYLMQEGTERSVSRATSQSV